MSASPRDVACDSRLPAGRVWVAAVTSVFLLVGCGGEKRNAGTPADTTTPAAAPAPAPAPAETAPAADTAKKDTATSMKRDTAATMPAAAKPAPAPADAPLRDAYHQPPRDTVSQEVYNGWKQYNLNCARCHGEDVAGTTIAPHLIISLRPDGPMNTRELFISTVCVGRPAKGMPAWCALGLEIDKIQEIYSYVKGRSDAKIAPGRPAVKSQG